MSRQKGSPKYGGRQKGTPNKTTEQLRELIQSFVEDNWKRIQKDFEALRPSERLSFINSLLRHILPEPTQFERLSEEQLSQLHEYLIKKYADEQETKN